MIGEPDGSVRSACPSGSGGTSPAGEVGPRHTSERVDTQEVDAWEIPTYLLRRRDGGFVHPSLHGETHVVGHSSDNRIAGHHYLGMGMGSSTALKFWPDDKLLTALSDHTISVIDRQPILEEAKKRHDQIKGYERITKRPFLSTGVPNVNS